MEAVVLKFPKILKKLRFGITPEYPTLPTVLGLGLRLGLGIRVRNRVVRGVFHSFCEYLKFGPISLKFSICDAIKQNESEVEKKIKF